jgi:hypothetical protein
MQRDVTSDKKKNPPGRDGFLVEIGNSSPEMADHETAK